MKPMNRRRFLCVTAATAGLTAWPAVAAGLHNWHGTALGAAASIHLSHPNAKAITARAVAEIGRLEGIFSLYRADSTLSRLNATGRIAAPPFELLECLSLCGRANVATGGLFDPTVQPLWSLYATSYANGARPDSAEVAKTLTVTGWHLVEFDSTSIRLEPGSALTLNGVAQGYIADCVAKLLRAEGLTDILINTGELRALGGNPLGGSWDVQIKDAGHVALNERALATSSALGTSFDALGSVGHILNPRTGRPAPEFWKTASISAPSAAVADALSTAACLMADRSALEHALSHFPQARIEALA